MVHVHASQIDSISKLNIKNMNSGSHNLTT